jgi:hypothetical protein
MRKLLCFLIILWLQINLPEIHGQEFSSLVARPIFKASELDTSRLLSDQPLKSPWGAVLRSALLPGWGQVYTGHYVKAGIAVAVNALFAFQIYKYEMKWRDEKNENFRNKRNQFSWYFALSYLITMADAYVDAYLYKFDVAMEISYETIHRDELWLAELRFSF